MNIGISLDFNFIDMATQTIIISLCLRTKDYRFLTIGCTVSKYCRLLKQYIFCFLIIDNHFDFGFHGNEI